MLGAMFGWTSWVKEHLHGDQELGSTLIGVLFTYVIAVLLMT